MGDCIMKKLLVLGLALMAMAVAASLTAAAQHDAATRPQSQAFSMIDEQVAFSEDQFGMIMLCPAHAHGSPEEADTKLKQIVASCPGKHNAVHVCHVNQLETLKRFAPLVDRVVTNPFVNPSSGSSKSGDSPIWPGCRHPLLDSLRALREAAPKTTLMAEVDLNGESYFSGRQPTFEEVQYMVLAVLGADYEGIVWRAASVAKPYADRFANLQSAILKYADELGLAHAADWARAETGQPVSTLVGGRLAFVIVLNPAYMSLSDDNRKVLFPMEQSSQQVRLRFSPPEGVSVVSGRSMGGTPLRIKPDGKELAIEVHLSGGGQMYVFELSKLPTSGPTTRPASVSL